MTVTKYEYASPLPPLLFLERKEGAAPAPSGAPQADDGMAPPEARPRSDSDLARDLQVRHLSNIGHEIQ